MVQQHPAAGACPQCRQPCAPLTLLTSMTRYFRCAACGRSWQVVREDNAAITR